MSVYATKSLRDKTAMILQRATNYWPGSKAFVVQHRTLGVILQADGSFAEYLDDALGVSPGFQAQVILGIKELDVVKLQDAARNLQAVLEKRLEAISARLARETV